MRGSVLRAPRATARTLHASARLTSAALPTSRLARGVWPAGTTWRLAAPWMAVLLPLLLAAALLRGAARSERTHA
eukprot:493454-Prymnesium_polylepis.2